MYDLLVLPPSFPYGGMVSVGRSSFEIKRTVDLKSINNFLLSHPNFSVLDLKKMLTTNFFFRFS